MTFYTFANATTAILLANLDANFATPITLGNTAVTINGTFSSLGNLTLNNATIASGNSTVTKETVTTITSPAATALTLQSAGTTAMTIDTSQNVGIGTTSPSYKLDVRTAVDAVQIFATNGTVQQAVAYNSGGISLVGTISNHPYTFLTNNTERMRIDTGGNLLVGTTSASLTNSNSVGIQGAIGLIFENHANGTASGTVYQYFAYNGGVIGSITQNGTTGVLYNIISDQRLKTNIIDAPSASSIIDAIQIRSFDWKSDGSHNRYGVIAQELNQLVPEAVHTPVDEKEMMGVDYSKLVPLLVKALQELKAEFDAYKAAHP